MGQRAVGVLGGGPRNIWGKWVPRNRLAQEPPPGSAVEFLHGIGFFMVLVDAGQLFSFA